MYEIYTVKKGDTIESIATNYNIDPSTIYKINGFTPDYILVEGASIVLPTMKNANFDYYTIQKGDSLYSIAKQYNTNPNLLAILNGLNLNDYIYPNQTIIVPKKDVSYYLVQENDTLNKVTKALNANPMNLINQNPNLYLLKDQLIVYRK